MVSANSGQSNIIISASHLVRKQQFYFQNNRYRNLHIQDLLTVPARSSGFPALHKKVETAKKHKTTANSKRSKKKRRYVVLN